MDPILAGLLGTGGTVGAIAGVVEVLIKGLAPTAQDTENRVASAAKRAEDAERRNNELHRQVEQLHRERNRALDAESAALRQVGELRARLAAVEAERDRLNTFGGGPL
ncbi:MAG: hypothetical protein HOV68_08755 [Streptomycetaceae bacterium]|nr:hypothetical protein [Streptomycetaceae bacterium]